MAREDFGTAMTFHRSSLDTPIHSFAENFQIAVLDILGPNTYFGLVKKDLLSAMNKESLEVSMPLPVLKSKIEKAENTKNFADIKEQFNNRGYNVKITPSESLSGATPFTRITISSQVFQPLDANEEALQLAHDGKAKPTSILTPRLLAPHTIEI